MSADALLLRFQVQGSAATPYQLTAEGVGAAFRMFCNCPAGRKARMMCKHVAALLMGEIGALVHPSDCVMKLAEWAHGSELIARAVHHQPKAARPTRSLEASLEAGIDVAFGSFVDIGIAKGWTVRTSMECIGFHAATKTGRVKKYPTLALGITDNAVRPFYVLAPESAGRNFGSAERAGAYFAEIIERFEP